MSRKIAEWEEIVKKLSGSKLATFAIAFDALREFKEFHESYKEQGVWVISKILDQEIERRSK